MRREWAQRFSSVDQVEEVSDFRESIRGLEQAVPPLNLGQGWAISNNVL